MIRKSLIVLLSFLCFVPVLSARTNRMQTFIDEFENHPEFIMVTAQRAALQNYPENSLAVMKKAINRVVERTKGKEDLRVGFA